jgi:hypothetical protein
MIRTAVARAALGAGLLITLASAPPSVVIAAQAGTQVTAADAAPFLGDWTLTLQGPNGPGVFDLTVKVEKEKVVGEISNAQMPAQAITDIAKVDKSLVLSYSFQWEGNPVGAVVSLIPAAEDKVNAQIDFAGGAYVMSGSAAKKEKPKDK